MKKLIVTWLGIDKLTLQIELMAIELLDLKNPPKYKIGDELVDEKLSCDTDEKISGKVVKVERGQSTIRYRWKYTIWNGTQLIERTPK